MRKTGIGSDWRVRYDQLINYSQVPAWVADDEFGS